MGRKQKEKTYIKSIRVNEDIKEFLESLENANIFVLQLLEDSNKFKKFVANKKNDNMTESLFKDFPELKDLQYNNKIQKKGKRNDNRRKNIKSKRKYKSYERN